MANRCAETLEWIKVEISTPVDQWVERTARQCRRRAWYDPRRWLCWLVTTLVKLVIWVVVTVGTWVVRSICAINVLIIRRSGAKSRVS